MSVLKKKREKKGMIEIKQVFLLCIYTWVIWARCSIIWTLLAWIFVHQLLMNNQVLDANPVHVKALYRRGMAYMGAGDFEEARSDFNKVFSIYFLLVEFSIALDILYLLMSCIFSDDEHWQVFWAYSKSCSN